MAVAKLFRPVQREIGETGRLVRLTLEGVYMRRAGERGWLGPYPYGSLELRCAETSADARRAQRRRRPRSRLVSRGLLATERRRERA